MKDLLVDREADQEIEETAAWYESKTEGLGWRFLEVLDQTLQLIANQPQAFARLRLGPADFMIRKALLHRFPYTVVFVELAGELRKLAVAHQKRRPGERLDRLG